MRTNDFRAKPVKYRIALKNGGCELQTWGEIGSIVLHSTPCSSLDVTGEIVCERERRRIKKELKLTVE